MNQMNNMLKQAQKLQQEMLKAQQELETKEFSASSGGDLVTVVINGKKEAKKIKISKEVVDPKEIEVLEDLIVSAYNSAIAKADEEAKGGLQDLTKGLNLPNLPSF